MPFPPRRYATPASEFGISKPLESWFDFAAAGTPRSGPAFSTALSEAENRNTQRELERLQLQRQLQSEQAVQEFMANAAGTRPQGLMRMLSESPEILTSEAAPAIQEYVASRQAQQAERKAAKQPFSNQILGPAILKSLPPLEQARLARRMKESGKSIVDVLEEDEQEQMMASERAKIQSKRIELLSKGADPRLVAEAESTENPFEAFAIVEGQMSRGSKGRAGDLYDRLDKTEKMLQAAMERSPDGGGTVDRLAALRDSILAEIEGSSQPVDGLPLPQAVGTTSMEPATTPVTAPAPAVVEPPLPAIPQTRFEQQRAAEEAKKAAAAAEIEAARSEAWTGAKKSAFNLAPGAAEADAARIFNLAKTAMTGGEITGTAQEKELASRVAGYARAAAEGKVFNVGVEVDAPGGKKETLSRRATPGWALLRDLEVNPFEVVEVPGQGILGSAKRMYAGDLMDLQLQEIAQPMIDRTAATEKATVTEEVKNKAAQFRGQ